MQSLWTVTIALMLAGATPAFAAPDTLRDSTPCATKSECELRRDQIDTENRRAEWEKNEKAAQDFTAARQQIHAQATAEAEAGKLSRIQEVMRRRREAAAQAGK